MDGPDFVDRHDFEDADRDFVGKLEPCAITTDDGQVVWDNDACGFFDAACPDTANPSLWRQAQLCALHDQTLRLMSEGCTGTEIAAMVELPPKFDADSQKFLDVLDPGNRGFAIVTP